MKTLNKFTRIIMKKITLEEKIKLITAYAEGKIVDTYDTLFQRWFAKGTDTWDFDREEYRIRPNSAPKFKVGDRLVYKSDEGSKDVERYKVTEATQEYYRLDDMINRTPEYVEKEFINIKDVLWYFEVFDLISKEGRTYPVRITMGDIDKELTPYHDTLMWGPMYIKGGVEMQTIQKIALKLVNAFLALIGLAFFSIYVVLLGSIIFLVSAPLYIVINFKEFMKDPLGFIKTMLIDIKNLLES